MKYMGPKLSDSFLLRYFVCQNSSFSVTSGESRPLQVHLVNHDRQHSMWIEATTFRTGTFQAKTTSSRHTCPFDVLIHSLQCLCHTLIGIGLLQRSQSLSKCNESITACVTFRMICPLFFTIFAAMSNALRLTLVAQLPIGMTSSKTSSLQVSNKKRRLGMGHIPFTLRTYQQKKSEYVK